MFVAAEAVKLAPVVEPKAEEIAVESSLVMEQGEEAKPVVEPVFQEPETTSTSISEPMESEEPLEREALLPPSQPLTRTTSSPFLDLRAPASPAGGNETSKLFFGKPFASQGTPSAPSIFQLPSSVTVAATPLLTSTPFGGTITGSGSAPLSLFGRPLAQSPASSPLVGAPIGDQPKGFGAIFGSNVPKGSFGSIPSLNSNPFATFRQASNVHEHTPEAFEDGEVDAPETAFEQTVDSNMDAAISDAEEGEEVASPSKGFVTADPKPPAGKADKSPVKPKPVVLSVSYALTYRFRHN